MSVYPKQLVAKSGKLHVAMIVRSFSPFGGLELYTYKLVEGLLNRGIKVTVICEQSELEPKDPNLRIFKFAQAQENAKKSTRIRHYYRTTSDAIENAGPFDIIHTQHLPIRKANVVTFHNHTVFQLSRVGRYWERLLNNLKIHTSQTYKLRNALDQELSTMAPALIFTSRRCKDDFRDTYKLTYYNPRASYTVAYPGADLSKKAINHCSAESNRLDSIGATLNRNGLDHGETKKYNNALPLTFLFVGKGYRKKGLDVLLKACRILRSENKFFQLLIAGLRQRFFDKLYLSTIGLTNYVTYLGFQKDMEAIYARASTIILPSRVEPFGMAPLQGMLRGLVPIVSRVSGISEIITNKHDGLILENHLNAEELAEHMCWVIDNPHLVTVLAANAITTAKSYTWEKMVDKTIDVYNSLVISQSPRS